MPLVKATDLVKPLADIAGAAANPESGDFWSKAERIISGIDKLLDHAIEARGGPAPGAEAARPAAVLASPAPAQEVEFRKPAPGPAQIAAAPTQSEAPQMKLNPILTAFLKDHINKCFQENPDMPIGQVIMKLPITVTMLKNLFDEHVK